MSFAKARQLLQLAEMAAARHGGVTLADIAADQWSDDYRAAWEEALGAIAGLMLAGAAKREAATS